MNNIFHVGLEKRWNNFTLAEQMANVGAEVGRTMSWKKKGNKTMSTHALYRGLVLHPLEFAI